MPESTPRPALSQRAYQYGDFPELFWDLRPEAPVDAEHPSILARVITQGSLDTISKLVDFATLRRNLDTLPVSEHTRRFWRQVLTLRQEEESASRESQKAGA